MLWVAGAGGGSGATALLFVAGPGGVGSEVTLLVTRRLGGGNGATIFLVGVPWRFGADVLSGACVVPRRR
jgi:hypothetical protein